MSTQKTVNVAIANNDLQTLKASNYNLCFAKKVGESFNVVWQSMNGKQYLAKNKIWWVPAFQIFGCNSFTAGVTVDEQTNAIDIGLGQKATLDQYGTMLPPVSGDQPDSIGLVNNFGPIHPGLSQLVSGADGQVTLPIYVAEQPIVSGTDYLTPKEEVMVWFEQKIETSTMFSDARSNSFIADLTNQDTVYLLYTDGQWVQTTELRGDSVGLDPILTLVFGVAVAVSAITVANKITSYLTGVYSNFKVDAALLEGKLKVSYSDKPGLSPDVRSAPGTRDMLLAFAGQALSSLGVPFTTLSGS